MQIPIPQYKRLYIAFLLLCGSLPFLSSQTTVTTKGSGTPITILGDETIKIFGDLVYDQEADGDQAAAQLNVEDGSGGNRIIVTGTVLNQMNFPILLEGDDAKSHFLFVSDQPFETLQGQLNFYQVTTNLSNPNGAELRLGNNISISNNLILEKGKFNLNSQTLSLVEPFYTESNVLPMNLYPKLEGESNIRRVYDSGSGGLLSMEDVFISGSGNFDFGNMGFNTNLNSFGNQTMQIKRGHQSQNINGAGSGIKRYFDIDWDGGQTVTTPFNVEFEYLTDEASEAGISDFSKLHLLRKKDGSSRWRSVSEVDGTPAGSTITETGLDTLLERWTLVPCEVPMDFSNIPDFTELCKGMSQTFEVNSPNLHAVKWSTGATTTSINYDYAIQNPGTEQLWVIVEDTKGCRSRKFFTVERLTTPEPDLGAGQNLCTGDELFLEPLTENGATFQYLWSNDETTSSLNYVSETAGLDMVWVEVFLPGMNLTNCAVRDTIFLNTTQTPQPDLGDNIAECDLEEVTLNASTPGETYQWYRRNFDTVEDELIPGATASTFTADEWGLYMVEVSNGSCTARAQVEAYFSEIEIASEVNDVDCFNGSDGTITLTASGGVLLDDPYSFDWAHNDDLFGTTAGALPAGTYVVTVTDNSFCEEVAEIEVGQPSEIQTNFTVTPNINCNQVGQINLMASGGTPIPDVPQGLEYNYLWNTSSTAAIIDGLGVGDGGTYLVTVTDANGCEHINSVDVVAPEILTLASSDLQDVTCNGETTGSFTTLTTGGTAPFTFDIGDGPVNQGAFSTLPAGDYNVTVIDAGTCEEVLPMTISGPEPIQVETLTTINADCGQSNGTLNLEVVGGGIPEYNFNWIDFEDETSAILQSQPPGVYTVEITDLLNCTVSFMLPIGNNDGPQIDEEATVVQDITCFADMNGTISPILTGPMDNLSIEWDNGETTLDLSNLGPGEYFLTVTDVATNCADFQNFMVVEPPLLTFNNPQVEDVPCNGEMNGSIVSNVVGGISDVYDYVWEDGSTGADRSDLEGGAYLLTVTDENGCTAEMSFPVAEPTAIEITSTIPDLLCNGDTDGTIDLESTGGPVPADQHLYSWDIGLGIQDLSGLSVGIYEVTVTSGNCQETASLELIEPDTILIDHILEDATCFGLLDGSIAVTLTGGVGDYVLNWSNGTVDVNNSGLNAGDYALTVSDANNCMVSEAYEILEPEVLALKSEVNAEACSEGGSEDGWIRLKIDGGTPAYEYQWSNGETTAFIENLTSAPYEVTVTDQQDCKLEQAFELPKAPAQFEVKFLAATEVKADSIVYFIDVSYPAPIAWFWQFGDPDNSTSTETNPTFAFPNNPDINDPLVSFYDVSMKATTEFCIDSLTKTIEVTNFRSDAPEPDTTIVIQGQFFEELSAYPNPTSGQLIIDILLSTSGDVDLNLMNMNGQLLRSFQLTGNDNYLQEFDLGDLPSGMYVLLAQFKNDRRGLKIVMVDE